jgi:cellulose synthase/poly-beta-1,6-N-acetylglucosamine synthase-like glycosyltransferase
MIWHEIVVISEWFFLLYFIGLHGSYLILNLISFLKLSRYTQERALDDLPRVDSGFELPISILVPAYNEEANITASIRSLLQLSYPEYEIIVINDGSKDRTLEALCKEFSLVRFPEVYRDRLPTQEVRAIYRSPTYSQLRVLDKANGGKADALNAGINSARYTLFCGLDADSLLQRDSLERLVRPFLEDPEMVACGGTVRIANGCQVRGGFLVGAGLPRNPLALFQIVEYLRAFLFGRLGWSQMNALLLISGAFGLFHKETVIEVGGYRHSTIGEDMELIVRMHRILRQARRAYRIAYVPDPVCWTEAPEDLKTLKNQRVRWQRGLCDSLSLNLGLLFDRRSGAAGWLAFPYMVIFEWLGPLIEVIGYGFMLLSFSLGLVSYTAMIAFMLMAVGLGLLNSVTALLLEEISFHIYPRPKHLLILLLVAAAENLGYRQLNSFWRLKGLMEWLLGKQAKWGEMTRNASLQSANSQTLSQSSPEPSTAAATDA